MGVIGIFSPERQCRGKRGFKHKRDAKRAVVRAATSKISAGDNRRIMTPYRCPHCDFWHIGHKPQVINPKVILPTEACQ